MIPLNRAVYCLDCFFLTASKGHHCEACGSTAIHRATLFIAPVESSAILTSGRACDEVAALEKLWRSE